MIVSSSICCQRPTCTAPESKWSPGRPGTRPCAPTGRPRASRRPSSLSTWAGVILRGRRRSEAVPDRLRRLAPRSAGRRCERASVVKASPRDSRRPSPKRGISLLHHAVRACQVLAGLFPVGGRDDLDRRLLGCRRGAHGVHCAEAQVVPSADSFSTMPCASSSCADRVGRGEVAAPPWRSARGGCASCDRRLVERRRRPAGRRAASACSKPSMPPSAFSRPRQRGRARAIDLAGQLEQHGHRHRACRSRRPSPPRNAAAWGSFQSSGDRRRCATPSSAV